jgi:sortase A
MVEPTPVADGDAAPPRLWQVIGIVGRALIATGVLLLLFVAYQLWGTGAQYSRSQHDLRAQFEAPATTTTAAPATTTTAVATSTATTTVETTTTPTLAVAVVEGDVLARLEIPRIGESTYVVAGVSVADLRRGPGHFPETALPGQTGNAAVAGHRTTYGAPFARIDELGAGDDVVLTVRSGQRYVYRVSAPPVIVAATAIDVLADTPGQATLTLISCHPKYTARDRIVVRAALVADVSAPPAPRTPPYQSAAPSTGVDTAGGDGSDASSPAPEPQVLTGGWFDDTGAWPGLVLWGVACGAAATAAWWIGRRQRPWIGVAAMVVPFVMFLYLFFENLNRLLPANL